MRPQFHPALVNGPFGDPALFIDCLFERRALLFDLGDIRAFSARKLLRLSDVFVSHAHMDHFMGFDWLLRLCLGRDQRLRLYGPGGFLAQVEHKLQAYTWNLVQGYATDFTVEATEIAPDWHARRALFRCRAAFRREREEGLALGDGVLREESEFRVRATFLDHKVPCLAFALEEREHVNVWKNRLEALGLPVGPWLNELKRAVRAGLPGDRPFRVWWRAGDRPEERFIPLGQLREQVLRIVPGQKIAYVTDAVYHADNAARIAELAGGADVLFVETPFLEQDAARAAERYHLTARQAGLLATRAGVKAVVPFHFSPKYRDGGAALRSELAQAFGGAIS
jgi:ribonuclease Z